ncbi:MAG: GH1 family beta-glucosidase [Meiothermus sp.]|uniref:GH1 family beta-glucosidase n=1 Tax=Meiothermus sp. TaxID=1955249 RepID=UPI0025F42A2C|nr:GH1 family beta-glucosidase [Meiothermus sp.]MCS7068019.1 GH1 family beta-glucosidase [Meiothermus sp.]MCX7600683.1 GH1 family beta-glucosidase [Meiothermus sp.]MDW8426075.1 GH1 family beta-glucosidase [Meiothermus sp.]
MTRSDFPSDFTWGTATAAYQIEGAVHADGRGPSIWDTFSHTPGKVRGGDTGDVACDHYHRYLEDIRLMKELGVNAYRFSVAWPRILPEGRGLPNPKGLGFYDRLVDALLAQGLTPWITLYHWDLPQALEDQGGWPARQTAYAFAEYAGLLSRHLGDRVKHWITLNEPWCSAHLGYLAGVHAPGQQDLGLAVRASHHLLLAHGLAVPLIRQNAPGAQVGITLNLSPAHPASPDPADVAAARRFDGFQNRWYLEPLFGLGYPQDMLALYGEVAPPVRSGDLETIATPTDFLGVNYYTRTVVRNSTLGPYRFQAVQVGEERTAMDWEVYPEGLAELLLRLSREYRPKALYITENGAAYPDEPGPSGEVHDPQRIRYLERHLAQSLEALREGAPLKGYFVWSLLDNFEWAEGYSRRFGLVYVDYATQQRRLKASGRWFRDFLREAVVRP